MPVDPLIIKRKSALPKAADLEARPCALAGLKCYQAIVAKDFY
jgi:hypothetical protein